MYKTPQRDALVDFSIPHFISSYGIFAENSSGIRGVEDLAATRVAVQQGDVGHDYLVETELAGELVIFNKWEDIFTAVINGEADCAVASMIQGSQLIRDRRYASLQQVGPPLIQQRYSMAVRKGDAELLAALVLGLGAFAWSALLRRQVYAKTLALTRELAHNEETRGKLAQALDEAEHSRQEAVEASKAKSVFLASISHELRTPLHGVIGIAHLLERSALDDDQRQLLGMLSGAASQLERLITDLLDLTRSATGILSLNPLAFRLGELAEWMKEPLRRQAESKGLNGTAFLSLSINWTMT